MPDCKLRENIRALVGTYQGSAQHLDEKEWLRLNPVEDGKTQLTLTPTLFWYDNIHIVVRSTHNHCYLALFLFSVSHTFSLSRKLSTTETLFSLKSTKWLLVGDLLKKR
jgi:hypothetical protein